jgi:hypothetical protein
MGWLPLLVSKPHLLSLQCVTLRSLPLSWKIGVAVFLHPTRSQKGNFAQSRFHARVMFSKITKYSQILWRGQLGSGLYRKSNKYDFVDLKGEVDVAFSGSRKSALKISDWHEA